MNDATEEAEHPLQRALLALSLGVVGAFFLWSRGLLAAEVQDPASHLAISAVVMGSLFCWFALFFSLLSKAPLARLGLQRPRATAARLAASLVAVVVLSHGLEAAIELLTGGAGSPAIRAIQDALAADRGAHLALLLLSVAGMAVVGEELFFRGMIQRGLERWLSPRMPRAASLLPIVVASSFFGAAHWEWIHITAAFFLGLALGAMVWRFDSLWPALGAHALNNAIAVFQGSFSLPIPGADWAPRVFAIATLSGGVGLLVWALSGPLGGIHEGEHSEDRRSANSN